MLIFRMFKLLLDHVVYLVMKIQLRTDLQLVPNDICILH